MRNPNGYGSIIKLSGKRRNPFAVRITVGYHENSSQKYKYIGYYPTRKDAMIALADYNNNPYDLEHAKLTFKDVFDKWSIKSFDSLSKSAKTSYMASYKHCTPIHNMQFQKLNTMALQNVIDDIKAPSAKFSTQLLLSQLYKYAIKHDIVQKNYAKMIEIEPLTVQKKAQVFTPDEIDTLWKNTHVDNLDIILILLYTGFRVMELLELKKENIYLSERYMIGGKKTKAGTDRIVPIHPRILPFLEKRMQNKYLFETKKGTQLTYSYFSRSNFKPILELFRMNHKIHDTRHTFITNLSALDIDKLTIKKIVGHTSYDITDHYTHKDLQTLIDAVDKLK